MSTELETIPAALPDVIALPSEIQTQLAKDREALRAQIGTVKLTEAQRAGLLVRATEAQVELKPTGEIYMPGVNYRQVLHSVFGPGAWGVRNGQPVMDVQEQDYKSTLYLQVLLVVGKCVRCHRSSIACECGQAIEQCGIAEDVGAQAYHPKNARLSYDDALTAAVTNGLMRCCSKTLGVFANCWEPRWADEARWQVGLKVSVKDWNGKTKVQWRRWDRRPLEGETGVVPDSPNADRYKQKVPTKADAPITRETFDAVITKAKGEQIGIIKKDAKGGYSVPTDVGVHWTNDAHMVRDLESIKARGKRVIFDDELVAGTTKKRIFSYTVV